MMLWRARFKRPGAGSGSARAVAIALPLLLASAAQAALPPKAQRLREVQKVAEEAARVLEEPIDSVERVDAVLYKVRAGACQLTARVVFEPRSDPGPQLFKVVPGAVQCR